MSRIRTAAGATQVAITGLAVGAAHPEPLQSRLAPLLQNVSRIRTAAGATQVAIIGLAVGTAHPEPRQSRLAPLLQNVSRIRTVVGATQVAITGRAYGAPWAGRGASDICIGAGAMDFSSASKA